ncbi:MAG TPA: hypothetical protein VF027_08310 [Sphingomicrobium sp.]
MVRWLAIGICTIGVAGAAPAAPILTVPLAPVQPHRFSPRAPELRIVRPPAAFDASPIRQTGMIADTAVMPNGRIGLGLFSVTRRSSPSEIKPDGRAPKSRKVGLSFRLRF